MESSSTLRLGPSNGVKCILIDPPDETPACAEASPFAKVSEDRSAGKPDSYQERRTHRSTEMHEVYPPLGIAYIAAVLKQNGIDVHLIESRTMGLSHDEVIEEVRKENPDFVGITAVTARINSALYLSTKIKEINTYIKVILGGPHVHFEHRDVINEPSVDFCVRGEGEITVFELIETVSRGGSLADIKGITFKQSDKVIVNPDRPFIQDLDTLPFPARGLYIIRFIEDYGRKAILLLRCWQQGVVRTFVNSAMPLPYGAGVTEGGLW